MLFVSAFQSDTVFPSKSYITSPLAIVCSVEIPDTVNPFGIIAVSVPSLYSLFPFVAVCPAVTVFPPAHPPEPPELPVAAASLSTISPKLAFSSEVFP